MVGNIPETSGKTGLDEEARRRDPARRWSLTKGETPNYLKAPGGSCHEHCKYGTPHTFNVKQRSVTRTKVRRKLHDDWESAENIAVAVPGLDNKPIIKLDESVDVSKEALTPDNGEVESIAKLGVKLNSPQESKTSFDQRKNVKLGATLMDRTSKKVSLEALARTSEAQSKLMKPNVKSVAAKQVSLPDSPQGSRQRRTSSGMTGKGTRTIKVAVKSSTASNSIESSVCRDTSRTQKKHIIQGVRSPLTKPSSSRDTKLEVTEEEVQEKILYAIDDGTEHKHSENDNSTSLPEDNQNGKTVNLTEGQSLRKAQHLSLPTLPYPQYHQEADHPSSDCIVTEGEDCPVSDSSNTNSRKKAEKSEREARRRTGKAGTGSAKNEAHKAVKLSFTRGKLGDVQSESSGSRSPRLIKGRALWVCRISKADNAQRRRFKRREESDSGKRSNISSSIKVDLKHQVAQKKKESETLFNNVIEETARKLVKTRKSKVKALVGAFETVISLQENNR